MPWTLEEIPLSVFRMKAFAHKPITPGTCWRVHLSESSQDGETYEQTHGYLLSPNFRSSGREYVILLALPNGEILNLDFQPLGDTGRGWNVTGELPKITVDPSINATGTYHGWLVDGVLSDDLEGRTY